MLYRGVVRGTDHPCLPRMRGSWNQVDLPELPTPGASSHMDSSLGQTHSAGDVQTMSPGPQPLGAWVVFLDL